MNKQVNLWLLCTFLCLISQPSDAQVYVQKCFSSPQAAYDFLIATEKISRKNRSKNSHAFLVNINTASESELTTLKGIGSSKAQEIIRYREGFGQFKRVDELTRVKGIGKKTVENNRSRLIVRY